MSIRFHRLDKSKEGSKGISRRMFLMTTTLAGITTSSMLRGVAFAQSSALSSAQSASVLRMVQDIYPHPDKLKLSHYEAIVTSVTQAAEEDTATAKTLTDGLAQLDAKAQALYGSTYAEIENADSREGLLRHFQHAGFFQSVRWTAYFGIYNNQDIWPLFGYQGSSVEHGGYINRGFSDITFVPAGPTLEERMAEVQK